MAIIECLNGHLYNPEDHEACPFCKKSEKISISKPQKPVDLTGIDVVKQLSVPIGGTPVTEPNIPIVPRANGEQSVEVPAATPVREPAVRPQGFGFGFGTSVADGGKTMSVMQSNVGFNPVVGWLACTHGVNRGKSYQIYGGINTVGRSEKMDICIKGDNKISSENHVKISYSDKNNRFKILPGDGKNISYLNDEEIYSAEMLNPYDVIDFGDTKLIFVPLCHDGFRWTKDEG